ncbi:MAG: ATP-binding cassette domain-containing protein [Chlamydiales bacterium]|nr:ATP-binding cassette domain-containing protein [Chlamydiales bacterium]
MADLNDQSDIAIEIRDLWKSFGPNQVMAGLDLDIMRGETLVILGRSGVGKSVLLKHIIGILRPDRGTVRVNGQLICQLKGKELYQAIMDMGMLFQGAALFDSMTVSDNVGFYLREHGGYSKDEIQERVDQALEMVGLSGTQDKLPSDLSGGMRKRAGLARLIVYRPKFLLYDEPTTGLDPITAMQINELIVQTQEELQATSIVVTHDAVSALFVGDRLALHENGKIAHIEKAEAFMKIEHPTIQFLKRTMTEDPRVFRSEMGHD